MWLAPFFEELFTSIYGMVNQPPNIADKMGLFFRFFGGGPAEEEERIVKGDDVIVDLEATLEDLYMGGTLKVRNYVS